MHRICPFCKTFRHRVKFPETLLDLKKKGIIEMSYSISPADFLKLQNEVKELASKLAIIESLYPTWIDIKTASAKLDKSPATLRTFIKRNSSELGVGTHFKNDEFKIENGTMLLHKKLILKLGAIYG